jgi:hypothetical protein
VITWCEAVLGRRKQGHQKDVLADGTKTESKGVGRMIGLLKPRPSRNLMITGPLFVSQNYGLYNFKTGPLSKKNRVLLFF